MNIIKRIQRDNINRREFLRKGVCAGFSTAGVFSAMSTLKLFEAQLAAQTPPPNYKAMICLFLFGGNDANNMLVPKETADYDSYAAIRGPLAIAKDTLLTINDPNSDGRLFGLHPALSPLRDIYGIPNSGAPNDPNQVTGPKNCAFIANVGTLVAPITKAEYLAGGAAIPPFLFSHNDQQVQWQTSVPESTKKIGWGGRIADLKKAMYGTSSISMNISVAGNNFFQIGQEVFQYQIGNSGSAGIDNWDSTDVRWAGRKPVLNSLFVHDYTNLFEQEYAAVTQRAIANDTLLKATLASIPSYLGTTSAHYFKPRNPAKPTVFTQLQQQLNIILRMIMAREELDMRRQIFFSSIGGFDTHDEQLENQEILLADLALSVKEFYQGTVALGVANDTTLFTASDFNRTFGSNGKGSDHAWGSHQFVVGGAVKGGKIYGRLPTLALNGPDDAGSRGAWIPTTSVDEYSGTLAKWFGVDASEMPQVLPNLSRFAHPDLGFMNNA